MDAILKIWNTFVTSNTFNFFVMLAIIFWIIKKADISNLFKKSVLVIKNKITDSENAKETEILNLNEAKKSVKNLDVEIKNIIEDAEQKAENLKNNILSEANVKVKNFHQF